MQSAKAMHVQALLENAGWVRQLARRLVRDPDLADDLAQETCLLALERQPDASRSLRGWLAAVLKNLVRQGARREHTRLSHEGRVARDEATGSTLDLIERISVERRVVEVLMELEEPYRTTILLRYFEGCTPSEIAERERVPLSTVKTRLGRGLGRLRERLAQRSDDQGCSWLLALVPLTQETGGAAASAIGALLVSTQVKVAAIAIALATGLFVAWPDRPEPAQVAAASAEVTAPEQAVLAATELREAEEAQPARQVAVVERAAEPTAAPAKTPAPAAREVTPLQGRVFGADASPLSGVALEFRSSAPGEGAPEDDAPRAVSRAGGRFVLEDVRGSGQIVAASDEYLTIYAGQASAARQDAEVIVVVAPRLELAGRVIDEAGRPIEGARLHVQLPTGFRGRFAHVMDYSTELPFRTSSDSAGRFALPAPLLDGASFVASSEGYETHHAPAPERTDEGMVVVLGRPGVGQGTLSGLVVDAQGHPVPEARVAYGLAATETDQDGVFSFEMDAEDSPNRLAERFIGTPARRLLAFKRGYLPASLRLELEGSAREVRWPDGIVLRLGESPLSLAGRVVAPDGRPLEGLQVWIADATVFSLDRERGAQVVENLLAATPAESPWRSVETSADGSFELDGLLDREYTVSVMDPATLVRVDSDPVPAGSEGVTITFDSEGLLERVAGRVVDRRGNPIAGISVFPMNDAFRLRYEGHVLSTSHGGVEGTITDAEGRFSLEDVAESLVYLRLNGEDTISVEYGRGVEGGLGSLSGGKLEELEIVVPLRVHVQVELEDPTEADSVAVLDEAGEEIVINVIQGTRRQETPRVPLEDGRSDVLTVTDSAATLVLYSGEERVREVPLELTRGELNSIRP